MAHTEDVKSADTPCLNCQMIYFCLMKVTFEGPGEVLIPVEITSASAFYGVTPHCPIFLSLPEIPFARRGPGA
jgi:hypothetical protein